MARVFGNYVMSLSESNEVEGCNLLKVVVILKVVVVIYSLW